MKFSGEFESKEGNLSVEICSHEFFLQHALPKSFGQLMPTGLSIRGYSVTIFLLHLREILNSYDYNYIVPT